MESTFDATSLKPIIPAEEPELDLYTIPSSSSWFSWDEIHETEKSSLKEFFVGISYSRTPKIYKEYRDFIINKYREEPSRKLTFTEVRKSLVGDVTLLHKVFKFLEKWGLINFSVHSGDGSAAIVYSGEVNGKVRAEAGAPNGVRVVATPNSLKTISVPLSVEGNGEAPENGLKLPPLASYADVFVDSLKKKTLVCGNCGENCDSGHHECTKEESSIICVKCFRKGNYGENKSADDFKYIENSGNNEAVWTEAETLLLLDSVLKHGDDWELVAQTIPTKSRLDCISKLIQLPFGELMLRSANRRDISIGTHGSMSIVKQVPLTSSESQDIIQVMDQSHEQKKNIGEYGNPENEGPPLKKQCILGNSLMKQVALMCTMVIPHITAAAADAAIFALCNENQLSRQIFNSKVDDSTNEIGSPTPNPDTERAHQIEDSEMKEMPFLSVLGISIADTQQKYLEKNAIPLTLQMKAATATALGAAAAHGKLLADQEEREMEHTVAAIIETQLTKLHCKVKLMEELEQIMENEYSLIEELEQSITAERIDVLQSVFDSGISRWMDHASSKL